MNRLRARDVMSHPVVSVHPDTKIAEVIRIMEERHISGLPVTDRLGRLVGIITEGDILLKEAGPGGLPLTSYMHLEGARSEADTQLERTRGTIVGDVMVRDVLTANEDAPVKQLAAIMARNGINRIPILLNRHVIGIVTRADVLKVFNRPDAELRMEVRHTLLEDAHIDPDLVRVDVTDRVVTLTGEVPEACDATFIQTLIREIDGIAGVDVSELRCSAAGSSG